MGTRIVFGSHSLTVVKNVRWQ
uniref:Uncharacterized protein n=1 Tax=Anguilla anguilla TaxID=7936 RepID=A0A0E9T8J4_ANGAN